MSIFLRCLKRSRNGLVIGSIAFLSLASVLLAVYPTYPSWWGPAINTNTKNDYARFGKNQGQLKSFALAGYEEFQAKIPAGMGGGGSGLRTLLRKWVQIGSNGMVVRQNGMPVMAAQDPDLPARNDYAPATLGQVKAVTELFYERLKQLDPNNPAWQYPWVLDGGVANDYAAANIGQLKRMFYFDMGIADADSDGLLDIVENGFGTSPTGGDSDGDGLSDTQEIAQHRDPNKKDHTSVKLWASGYVAP